MNMAQKQSNHPLGWSEAEIRQLAEFHDSLTEEEWIAHYEADCEREGYTHLTIPSGLMDAVGKIIAQYETEAWAVGDGDVSPTPAKGATPAEGDFPSGWNSERVQRLIAEMEAEEAQWTAADEAELQRELKGQVLVQVPDAALPAINDLLAEHAAAGQRTADV